MLDTESPVEKLLAEILKEQENKLSAPIITSDEIEQDYKISKRELVPLIKAHKIPVIRINKRVLRFHRSDIEQFIAARTIGAVTNL
jgi:predicted DNA-binding transcriptional regulator AlpA